ncbi:cupredoxin domain-containing protein [Microbacterium sp. No. 7]|uniref:cupredoxin domain-containing protein n=1 Tax=Microbacterium sp. No. 7 TaxID=1714373 RepID=UPI0006D1F9C1|nr:plastocyanin/azurin family copper-binding protein [Microbacterium sp. No. 7]ALJ21594.1 copper-binding protein [Microbacterium sp. No. 7]
MKLRTLVVPVALAAAVVVLAGCSDAAPEPAVTVMVTDMSYQPADITVKPGDTVEWVFDDGGMPHDVAGDGPLEGVLQSELLTEGSYTYTFDEAGEFGYHCTPHPMMVGTVTVEG